MIYDYTHDNHWQLVFYGRLGAQTVLQDEAGEIHFKDHLPRGMTTLVTLEVNVTAFGQSLASQSDRILFM